MEREILDVLKAFEDKKITIIEAHIKLSVLCNGEICTRCYSLIA